MVGRQVLVLLILVRVQVSEPRNIKRRESVVFSYSKRGFKIK